MQKCLLFAVSLMSLIYALGTKAAEPITDYGQPTVTAVTVSFPYGSRKFQPDAATAELLEDAGEAAMIYVSGRTSGQTPSASDEALALQRALSARSYLMERGVSPLKIMINFASAADFIADNSIPEGRNQNQRVDIELFHMAKN